MSDSPQSQPPGRAAAALAAAQAAVAQQMPQAGQVLKQPERKSPKSTPREHSPFREQMAQRSAEIQQSRVAGAACPAVIMETRNPAKLLAFDDDPRVFCLSDLTQRLGPNEGLVMSQLVYWFREPEGDQRPRARARRDDGRWLEKSGKALSAETGLTLRKTQRAVKSLRDQGLIEQHSSLIRPTAAFCRTEIRNTGVLVYAPTVRMTGDAAAAIVLSQVCYWSDNDHQGRCRLRVCKHGRYWVAKTYEDLAAETGLTDRRARSAVDRLAGQGLIVRDHFIFGGVRTMHLRLDPDVFGDAWVDSVKM